MFNLIFSPLLFWPLLAQTPAQPSAQPSVLPLQAAVEVCPGLQDSFAATREAALNEARREILLQGGEVWLSAQTLTANAVVQEDWLQLFSTGVLSQEKVLVEHWLPAQKAQPPCYFLRLQAQVSHLPRPPVAEGALRLWLSHTELQEGQPVELNLLSSQGGYLTLLNVSSDGSVTLLLPNARHPQPYYLPPLELQRFPALMAQNDLQLVARVLPGQARSREVLKAILTQTPLSLQTAPFKQGLFQVYDRFGTGLYSDLQRLLLALEPGSWQENSVAYQVSRD